MDDCCIFAINDAVINNLIASLGEEFVVQDEGSIEKDLEILPTPICDVCIVRTGP